MKRIILVTMVLVAVVLAIENPDGKLLTKSSAKTITQKINYQGYLTDNSSNPITNPSLSITFKIYDDEFAGSVQWEATKSVSVENGVFSTLLDVPANVFTAGAPRWLELTIGGNALTPRTELTAVGYSYKTIDADKLQGLAPSEFVKNGDPASGDLTGTYPSPTIANNAVTTNKIANGNVTMAKIAQAGATTGQVIKWNGSAWSPADDNTGGGGTVSSVGLSMPGQFSVSGSPVTTSGTLTANWVNQNPNVVFAGPSSEKEIEDNPDAGAPTFRTLVPADIPNLDASKITSGVLPIARGGTNSGTALNNNRIMVSNSGAITEAPALTNGQLLIGSSNTAPVAANITAGTGISVTNGAGSITISTSGGPFLPLAGGTMTGAITNTGDPSITMGKGNFGSGNINTGTMAFVAGMNNRARGAYSVVGGGGGSTLADSNSAQGDKSTVSGGSVNSASGSWATVGGGKYNRAYGDFSVVSGGGGSFAVDSNSALGMGSTISGGRRNSASSNYATVGGGFTNSANGGATVGGGTTNTASGWASTVSGGFQNSASDDYATVAGGGGNSASGWVSTVSGGGGNSASGSYATVAGGYQDTSAAFYSFTTNYGSKVPSGYTNSSAFNGQIATASGQTRVGAISKASGTFTIDHPLDPMNKILNHYFVESPEMVLIYRGSVVIGADGKAVVHLPDYFDALNQNPMIQLTGVGSPDVVYVLEKVKGNQFVIGGKPGTEVYWIVTGDRKDPSAEITRIIMPVEQTKDAELRGRSLDDDFLSVTKEQLDRMGKGNLFNFRTTFGQQKYENSKQRSIENEIERMKK